MGEILRGAFGYCFLVLMVRLVGRRPGKQMTPLYFVLIFFIGRVTLTPMVGEDRSIINALSIITAIAATHFLIATLKHHFPAFGRVVDGTPLVLLEKGKWHTETMNKMRIQAQDVMAMARDNGLERLEQIEYATLERNGEISIIPASDEE
jgi:uncharacterized membrane protein YcaP (DUF421 family)